MLCSSGKVTNPKTLRWISWWISGCQRLCPEATATFFWPNLPWLISISVEVRWKFRFRYRLNKCMDKALRVWIGCCRSCNIEGSCLITNQTEEILDCLFFSLEKCESPVRQPISVQTSGQFAKIYLPARFLMGCLELTFVKLSPFPPAANHDEGLL